MNSERLRVTRFRKMKKQEVSPFVPIAKQMKAVAIPVQVAEPVKYDEYYGDGYFWFPPFCIKIDFPFGIKVSKRKCRSFIKLLAYALHANKKNFKFQNYINDEYVVTCLCFPPIRISVIACLFANELYKRQEITTWHDAQRFRLTVLR